MDQSKQTELPAATDRTDAKVTWTTPVLTKLKVEDAESGSNISENGATGS